MRVKKEAKNLSKIKKLFFEGASLREIAAIEGCHKTTIKRRLERSGYKMRPPGIIPGKKSTLPLSDKEKEQLLKGLYRMTSKDYYEMYTAQRGKCAICGKKIPNEWKLGVCIDHCHKTSVVRGLLCPRCNMGLGQFRDDADLLFAAGSYLTAFEKNR